MLTYVIIFPPLPGKAGVFQESWRTFRLFLLFLFMPTTGLAVTKTPIVPSIPDLLSLFLSSTSFKSSFGHSPKAPALANREQMWYDKTTCDARSRLFQEVFDLEKETQKKVLLSGIQPSGDLHLGNYLGAIKNWAELSDQFECYWFMADLHTITVRQNPADLRRRTLTQIAVYIACGLDPEKNTIFVQSHVPAHAELGWVLDCYTMFGELSRMTQFKDKSAKHADNINAGLFTYPCLMAADILLYQPDFVPVGEDQKQHVEICRDIANRFNHVYGEVFRMPEPYIPKQGARVMSLNQPDTKMSKSIPEGCVFLLEKPEDILRKFKRAVTDSDTEHCVRYAPGEKPGVSNLIQIYAACTGKSFEDVEREFDGKGYGVFKPAVGEAVVETLRPIREETERLLADKAYLESVYRAGAEKASYVANKTLRKVYKKVGFLAP